MAAESGEAVPDLEHETRYGFPLRLLAGVDEVGRGCLAGPVVAAAVILPSEVNYEIDGWLFEVADSKMLKPEVRAVLDIRIRSWVHAFAVGVASVEEIDEINIYHASHLAMKRAVEGLGFRPDHVLVDGKYPPSQMSTPATAIVKGDQKCLSIACASIIAKVWRDEHMRELEKEYPHFGFGTHKGYPTPFHLEALSKFGVSQIHRKTFSPVTELLAGNSREFKNSNVRVFSEI